MNPRLLYFKVLIQGEFLLNVSSWDNVLPNEVLLDARWIICPVSCCEGIVIGSSLNVVGFSSRQHINEHNYKEIR